MQTPRFNVAILVLLGAFVFLQYRLWIESGGVRDVMHAKNTLLEQEKSVERIRQDNKKLVSQIDRLKNSNDATESRARNELGMIKEGETFYQIVK